MRSTVQHEQAPPPFFLFAELGLLLLDGAALLSLFWWYSGMSPLGAIAKGGFDNSQDMQKRGQRPGDRGKSGW